jgi:hypothetical protein
LTFEATRQKGLIYPGAPRCFSEISKGFRAARRDGRGTSLAHRPVGTPSDNVSAPADWITPADALQTGDA